MDGTTRHGSLVSTQLLDVAIRVRAIREFAANQMVSLRHNGPLDNKLLKYCCITIALLPYLLQSTGNCLLLLKSTRVIVVIWINIYLTIKVTWMHTSVPKLELPLIPIFRGTLENLITSYSLYEVWQKRNRTVVIEILIQHILILCELSPLK